MEGVAEHRAGLRVRVPREAPFGCALQVRDCAWRVIGSRPVVREEAADVVGPARIQLLEAEAHRSVRRPPHLRADAVVRHVLGQGVLELISALALDDRLDEELLPHELLHAGVGGFGARQHRRKQPRREAAAEDRRRLEDRAGPSPEPVDARHQHVLHLPGHYALPHAARTREGELLKEERVALAPRQDRPAERLGDLLGPEYRADDLE